MNNLKVSIVVNQELYCKKSDFSDLKSNFQQLLGLRHQKYFTEHFPALTDIEKENNTIEEFYTEMGLNFIKYNYEKTI